MKNNNKIESRLYELQGARALHIFMTAAAWPRTTTTTTSKALTRPCTLANCMCCFNASDPVTHNTTRYVLGHEAMARMGAANVLLLGLGGLGVEIGMPTAPYIPRHHQPLTKSHSQEYHFSRRQGRYALRPRPSDALGSLLSSAACILYHVARQANLNGT